jgi:oligosaccharide translocation protein RFT1
MQQSSLDRSLTGAKYILTQQLFSRALTFAANVFLVRVSHINTMAHVFDMELYSATILFISRESYRLALLRNLKQSVNSDQLIINVSFIPPLIGTALMIICLLNLGQLETYRWNTYVIYSLACLIELMTEPMYIYAQRRFLYDIRVKSEGGY